MCVCVVVEYTQSAFKFVVLATRYARVRQATRESTIKRYYRLGTAGMNLFFNSSEIWYNCLEILMPLAPR